MEEELMPWKEMTVQNLQEFFIPLGSFPVEFQKLRVVALVRLFLIIPTLFLFTLHSLLTMKTQAHAPEVMDRIILTWGFMALLYLLSNLALYLLPENKKKLSFSLIYLGIILELGTNQLLLYSLGSLTSHATLFIILTVVVYRVFFDFFSSLFAAISGVLFFSISALLEVAGIITLAPGLPEAIQHPIYTGDPSFFPLRIIQAVILGIFTAFIIINFGMNQAHKLENTLHNLSMKDGLTGLFNRRYFDQQLLQELKRAQRSSNPLTLILIDIDFFKNFNDQFGHLRGDDCLKEIASSLKSCLQRPGDIIARYGGEEFAVILPETSLEKGALVAEKLRQKIVALQIPAPPSTGDAWVTISLGLASSNSEEDAPELLLDRADLALYQAKEKGRNRIELTA